MPSQPNNNSIELTDFARHLKQNDGDIDILGLSNAWLDDGMRGLFASGSVVLALQEAKRLFPDRFMNIFGGAWNLVDSIGAIVAGADGLNNMWQSQRQDKQKKATHISNIALGAQLLGTGTASFLAQESIITGAMATTMAPLGGFGFAICMWGSAIHAALELHRACKKTDPIYLTYDRIKKVEGLSEKIQKYQSKLLETSNKKKIKIINDRIDSLKKMRKRVNKQACALIKVHHAELKNMQQYNQLKARCIKLNIEAFDKYGNVRNASKSDKTLSGYLVQKQHENVNKHAISLFTWTTAAVGMTMIAFSFLCPALLIPGIALSAVSGFLKINEIHNSFCSWVDGKKNKSKHIDAVKSDAIKDIKNSDHFNDGSLAKLALDDKLNTIMAYHLTCDEMDKSAKQPTLASFVKQLGKSLQGKKHRKFLKCARQRYLENKALLQSFGIDGVNNVFSSQERSHLFSHKPRKQVPSQPAVVQGNSAPIAKSH